MGNATASHITQYCCSCSQTRKQCHIFKTFMCYLYIMI
jgi:hypothetical protein